MLPHPSVTSYFAGRLHQEGDLFVSQCEGLPVASQGRSESDAIVNLAEAVQLFVDDAIAHGSLGAVVRRYGWQATQELPGRDSSDRFVIPVRVPHHVASSLESSA